MTALQPCPACRQDTTKALVNLSSIPSVKFYRCEACGHVWVTGQDGRVHHVTPLKNVAQSKAGVSGP